MSNGVQCTGVNYYRRAFQSYSSSEPFTPSGPPEHMLTLALTGGQAQNIPHQIAWTHTEVTTYPKNWGRAYWPAPGGSSSLWAAGGKIASAAVDALCTAVNAFGNTLQAADFFPCVPTTSVGGVPSRQLLGIQEIQVDNVADVQRRRRAHVSTYKKRLP
jgi:hypothetical protein